VWQNFGHDGSATGVFARRFDSTGAGGGEFQVNLRTLSNQNYPAVSIASGGALRDRLDRLRPGWADLGILARRFTSAGAPIGGEFLVNSYTEGSQQYPTVALDGDGDFVVAWQDYGQDGDLRGVFAQRFDSTGHAVDTEFQVTSYTGNRQAYPAVAADQAGDFVVVWQSYGQDLSQNGVFAQRFDNVAVLDIDGNGSTAALTDGLAGAALPVRIHRLDADRRRGRRRALPALRRAHDPGVICRR
jgi:hypothetical protein